MKYNRIIMCPGWKMFSWTRNVSHFDINFGLLMNQNGCVKVANVNKLAESASSAIKLQFNYVELSCDCISVADARWHINGRAPQSCHTRKKLLWAKCVGRTGLDLIRLSEIYFGRLFDKIWLRLNYSWMTNCVSRMCSQCSWNVHKLVSMTMTRNQCENRKRSNTLGSHVLRRSTWT